MAEGIVAWFAAHPGPHTLAAGTAEAQQALALAAAGRLTLLQRRPGADRFQHDERHSPMLIDPAYCP